MTATSPTASADVEFKLPRVQVVALLDATEGHAMGPLVAARNQLRNALGTAEVHARAQALRPADASELVGRRLTNEAMLAAIYKEDQ